MSDYPLRLAARGLKKLGLLFRRQYPSDDVASLREHLDVIGHDPPALGAFHHEPKDANIHVDRFAR